MVELKSKQIWEALQDVKDPEIPAVSVVEMGMIRNIGVEKGRVIVTMTPTFAGCPALQVMQANIEGRLRQEGAEEVAVKVTLSPPWSTDWVTPEGRQKLKDFGLAPPPRHLGLLEEVLQEPATCPYCGSKDTTLKNNFGPTLCRAIYYCNNCQQPFEQFKPV